MDASRSRGLACWCLVGLSLLSPGLAWSEATLVQQIGRHSSEVLEAIASEVTIVPLSRTIDPRTTPIILAAAKAGLGPDDDGPVRGLTRGQREAIRTAYTTGQTILVPDASVHDVEALHALLNVGTVHESDTDPILLAYALRKVDGIPTARVVLYPEGFEPTDEDDALPDEFAFEEAIRVVLDELTRPPVRARAVAAASNDWSSSPVQKTTLTSTARGVFNTPVQVYALHSCSDRLDYYLVNTGGTWTPTRARYESAACDGVGTSRPYRDDFKADPDRINCITGPGPRVCRYIDYPLSYRIEIVPPSGPKVIQTNSTPSANPGVSSTYTSGFDFSIGGGVNVSGAGPSGGFQSSATWSNSVSTSVPPLFISAGIVGNQGAYTEYRYCTDGDTKDACESEIQMAGKGICINWEVGKPVNGQTPGGRLSNVAQTVNWEVDPATYRGSTFDITVRWQAEMATSTSLLFQKTKGTRNPRLGHCNGFGCSCSIDTVKRTTTVEHVFKVPFPSRNCS